MRMFLASLLATAAVAAPTTLPPDNVTATGATLKGTVDGPGMVHFEYGTTASGAYGVATANQNVTTPGEVTASATGLTPETEYQYRIVANGQVGNTQIFTTAPNPKPPAVSDQRARDIVADSATATALINPNGSATTYQVEYGTTTRYGSETPSAQTPSTATSSVSVKLSGLRPYTRYHWRTVATNAAGTTRGADRSFRTARLPTAVSLSLSRKTVPWGGDLRLGGRVSGSGVAGLTVELQQQRFPQDQDFTALSTARTGSDGGYLFTIPKLWTTTRYRVVTRTQTVATSPVATARSRVRVGIAARHFARKRARVEGTVLPAVHGTISLQQYRSGVGWRQVRATTLAPADELRSRYRFVVRRLKRVSRRFRVIAAPVRGAHVRGWSRSVVVSARPRKGRG